MDWISLAGSILQLVLRIIDGWQKGTIDQAKLDLIVLALREPPPPAKDSDPK